MSTPRFSSRTSETFFSVLFFICGMAAVGFVACISLYLIIAGVPGIQHIGLGAFLLGQR